MKDGLVQEKLTLQITGMTCSACAHRIEKSVEKMSGIDSIFVNLALEKAYIRLVPEEADVRQVLDRVHQLGFRAAVSEQNESGISSSSTVQLFRNRFLLSALFTLPLLWPMLHHFTWTSFLWVPEWLQIPWVQLLLAIPVQFIWGWPFLDGAYRSLKNGYANMDVLVTLGTLSAFGYSHYLVFHPPAGFHHGHSPLYFETSAMIISVIWLGKWMEAKARNHVRQSTEGWGGLLPSTVRRVREDCEELLEPHQIRKGEEVLIRSGEIVPVDGIVLEGSALIDESALTGESHSLEKQAGTKVSAGTRIIQGTLKVKVEQTGGQTLLGHIIRSFEETQSAKPAIQTKADKAAAWFVPIIIGLAAITFLYWFKLRTLGDAGIALKAAISVIISACPCAIGLATPLSVFIGSRRAAELGISFRSGKALEALSRTDTILFDKTGTVTMGVPMVTDISARALPTLEFLRLIASAEKECEHPIAGALVREAGRRGIVLTQAEYWTELPGYGVEAKLEGKFLLIGSKRLLLSRNVKGIQSGDADQWEAQGKTVLYVAVDGEWAGSSAITDSLRPGTTAAIRSLKKKGIQLSLITGDSYKAAAYTAKLCGFEHFQAGVLPNEKMEHVLQLQQQQRKIAMVGDGMNDAPAMAAAHIGISVRNATTAAKEAADVLLNREDSKALVDAFQISSMTVTNIRQNLGFAFVYNALLIPSAMLGHVEPWAAGSAMTLSSLTVVLNALRLKRILRRKLG
ncbi:heavy metal translocating P-type ATPase [Paenibacillus eucommiae]|uniref:P-type Cu(+) transporter n=1 Tax=Paenibacillus eucommiae TaxID=1355755 RepID=A0ABS4IQ86_9BACL|nr:cation-translocating P-type ATPase [Paenibacillus eucommiae]MBP1989733.1 Cu+-exporting ATPase [Paenibacillus eucommiae]